MSESIEDRRKRQERFWLRVVIILGVLIFVGLAVMIGTVITRIGMQQADSVVETVHLDVPKGTELVSVDAEEYYLALHVKLPDGSAMVILMSRRTGRELRRFVLP